jgi:hypothetical protein
MADEKMTEKVYCYNHPSQDNSLPLMAAMMSQNKGCDPMVMAALMNNNAENNWMNNPFAYIMFMMLFRQFGGFGGPGGPGGMGDGSGQAQQNIEVQNQLAAIRSQLSDSQNSGLIMEAIRGNATAIGQLAQTLNCDFGTLNNAVCDVRAGIDKVAGQVGFSAERVINAVNLGDSSIVSKLQECCCQTKTAILEMGYQNQLANCQQTGALTSAINGGVNSLQNNLTHLGFGMQQGFTNLGNITQQGFSSIGYATQQQTCEILQGQQASTQRIIDTLNCHWNQDLQQRYNDARLELSQLKQNETLIAALKTTTTA